MNKRLVYTLAAISAVVLIFAISVIARVPQLEDPVSEVRHGEGTARVIRHMRIWNEVGMAETHFMMRTTGTEPADRFISDVGYLRSDDGIFYYVSFPPLFPMAPHAAFKLLGMEPTISAVRGFNLFLHAVTIALIFLLARRVTRGLGDRSSLMASAVAASAYALAPATLWYHSNAYVTASLSTPLFALAALLAIHLLYDEAPNRYLWAGYIAAVALLAYADWLAFTFAAAVIVMAIFRRKDRPWRMLAIATAATCAVVLAVVVAQYSSIAGFSAFVDGISGKYVMRSGFSDTSHYAITSMQSWGQILAIYRLHYLPIFVVTWLLFIPAFGDRAGRDGLRLALSGPMATALILTALATFIHHVVFFSHSVIHDFDMLKSAVPLCLLAGVVITAGFSRFRRATTLRHAVLLLAVIAVVATLGGYNDSLRRNFGNYPHAQDVGLTVRRANVAPDEVAFLAIQGDTFYRGSAAVIYARRNLALYSTPEAAANRIEKAGATGGVLFQIDSTGRLVEAVHRVLPDGSLTEYDGPGVKDSE